MRLVAVTGVSIGAINAACVVGAKDRADARKRLQSPVVRSVAGRAEATGGLPQAAISHCSVCRGFYAPRPDFWNFLDWTNFYDTDPMLGTLKSMWISIR